VSYNIDQEIPEASKGTNEFSYKNVVIKLGKMHRGLKTKLFILLQA